MLAAVAFAAHLFIESRRSNRTSARVTFVYYKGCDAWTDLEPRCHLRCPLPALYHSVHHHLVPSFLPLQMFTRAPTAAARALTFSLSRERGTTVNYMAPAKYRFRKLVSWATDTYSTTCFFCFFVVVLLCAAKELVSPWEETANTDHACTGSLWALSVQSVV